jgi:hypothetical protein
MFYKVMFWIFFAMFVLVVGGFAFMYVMACMMGMPDCVI